MEVTHERESLTRELQCTGENDEPTRLGTTVRNGLESSSLQTPLNESQNGNSVQDALSNSLVMEIFDNMHDIRVLRKLFSYLNDEDLESCCHVSLNWRTAADPLVVSLYEIELSIYDSTSDSVRMNDTLVRERDRYNRKNVTERKDLEGFTQILDLILTQTKKLSISLKVSCQVDILDEKVMDFLSKLGPFVQILDFFHQTMSAVDISKLLVQIFPSLKKLKIARHPLRSGLHVGHTQGQRFDTDLAKNQHKLLRTISFGYGDFNSSDMVTILKICPNLKEIEGFPLEVINAIHTSQKGEALKSLAGSWTPDRFPQNEETAVTAYEKLARLQPKLTSLKLNPQLFASVYEITPMFKTFYFSVLHSSHESLESLVISYISSDEAQHFPVLTGLKEVEFYKEFNDRPAGAIFFPPEMQLTNIFPNVRKIISKAGWDEAYINRYLPENAISPWGTQISQLCVRGIVVSCIPKVQRLFPFVQQLRLNILAKNMSNSLLQLTQCWPQLKSLTISVVLYCSIEHKWMEGGPVNLDHAFTGLPEEVIDQLVDPSRKKVFTEEEIQGFKERSIIGKMKELKELKILLRDQISPRRLGVHMQLTPVANEFGFKLLPDCKVMVVKGISIGPDPLALCSNIELLTDIPGIEINKM